FDRERETLVLPCGDFYARLMDCASQRPIGRPLRGDLSFPIFSPDGRRLATAAYSYRTGQAPWVRLRDGRSGKPSVAPLCAPQCAYGQPAFSPDGRTLAVPCVGMTLLLDAGSNRIRHRLIQRNVQYAAAFSRDGTRVAVGAGTWGKDLGEGVRL